MFQLILIIIVGIIALSFAALILYARWNYGKLNGLGFPVMKPTFLKGSVPDIHKHIQHFEDMKRFKKYGSVWGVRNSE